MRTLIDCDNRSTGGSNGRSDNDGSRAGAGQGREKDHRPEGGGEEGGHVLGQ
jgi:hypothetical protein